MRNRSAAVAAGRRGTPSRNPHIPFTVTARRLSIFPPRQGPIAPRRDTMNPAKPIRRREMFKFGALGSAALLLPLERRAFTSGNSTAVRMPSSKLPKPYTLPFATPPVATPYKSDVLLPYQDGTKKLHDVYRIHQQAVDAQILPGKLTGIYGYNGVTPGVTIRARQGRPIVVQHENNLGPVNKQLFTSGGYTP